MVVLKTDVLKKVHWILGGIILEKTKNGDYVRKYKRKYVGRKA